MYTLTIRYSDKDGQMKSGVIKPRNTLSAALGAAELHTKSLERAGNQLVNILITYIP